MRKCSQMSFKWKQIERQNNKQKQQQQKRSPVQGSKGSALTQPSCCGMLQKSETETEAERERASESEGVMAKKRTMLVQNGRGRRGTAQVTMTMTTLPCLASPKQCDDDVCDIFPKMLPLPLSSATRKASTMTLTLFFPLFFGF